MRSLIPTMSKVYRISALPLPASSSLLIHNLSPDTHTPDIPAFRAVQEATPSLQRRARLLSPQSHYSYVAPFPVPFPYDIEPPVDTNPTDDKSKYIEQWLSAREAKHLSSDLHLPNQSLQLLYPENRDQPRVLIGLSKTGFSDCVPHLDVGDAFSVLGTPALSDEFSDDGDGVIAKDGEGVSARNELVDVLSGHAMLMSPPSTSGVAPRGKSGFAPWSLRYSGHQFGSWAGQLGDGRAISIMVTPHPLDQEQTYELQLKGAGRTPFSRSADGLAVLRSSIREYLCSEAMHALHIPTTRSLSLISLPGIPVVRERVEFGCILTRMAPSFIRIGSFEAVNGPTNMFFFGGGQQKPDLEALRILGEWTAKQVLRLGKNEDEMWGRDLVLEVAKRNARMVAGWQAYGFMHGVINTDNVSILGLTIDYGPYAFMDVFDSFHICNHTDETGRYAYKYQPDMITFALRALLTSLAPLIGAEFEQQRAVSAGWADNTTEEQIEAWKNKGLEMRKELESVIEETIAIEYDMLMRKRLNLRQPETTDGRNLFRPLLDLMETYKLDFHSTFRTLTEFSPYLMDHASSLTAQVDEKLHAFITRLLSITPDPDRTDYGAGTEAWLKWLETYSKRLQEEADNWPGGEEERINAGKQANPRFVLRQWVLEDVISRVERDADSGKRVLAKVMHMACNPYQPWGAEGDGRPDGELTKEELEERKYCGLGDKKMLGFQCSCSS